MSMDARAAMRDASWWSNPGRATRYHIIDTRKGSVGSYVADVMARCGTPMIVNDYTLTRLTEVPQALRCKKNGCKQGWPL